MTPETILVTIKSAADAFAEFFRFLSTEQGQALVKKNLEDQVKFEKAVSKIGTEVDQFFTNLAKAIEGK